MKRPHRLVPLALLLMALAQTPHAQTAEDTPEPREPIVPTALDAELFYQLILGEINARDSEPSAGFSLILDAAPSDDAPCLYRTR